MKNFMGVINTAVMAASLIGIIWCLVAGWFSTAWLWVIPLIYSWWNILAIIEEDR